MCTWKQFTSLRKLKLRHFSLQGRFDMLLSRCVVNNFSVFSHRWTQQQLLSVVGLFTTSIHILWVCLFRFSSWAGQVILFNYSYSPIRLAESFILWSTGEFTDGFGIQLTKMKNMNADPSKCLFFFLAETVQGTGSELRISGRQKKKDMWQSAWWAIYEIDSGHSDPGRKWKTSVYEMFRLSLEVESVPVSSQEADTGRSQIRKYIDRPVKQEGRRTTKRGPYQRVKGWLPLGSRLDHIVGLV